MHAKLSQLTVASVCFLLAACGGSSSPSAGGSTADGSTALSGALIGPRIAGLHYGSAMTSANGEFAFKDAQQLSFQLDSLNIATVTARPYLSLYDMVGSAAQYRFDKAVRVGQLLLSLDDDGDARNGVQLSGVSGANDLKWELSDSLWQDAASTLVDRMSNGAKSLVSRRQSMETMTSHLRAEDETCSAGASSVEGFAIADPRCSDRARLALWREDLSTTLVQLQHGVDQLLDGQETVDSWWASSHSDWQPLLQQAEEAHVWLSYALAGADIPTKRAIETALNNNGVLSASARSELERWREGGAKAMRLRDQQERELLAQVVEAWLGYGFDQQALRSAYGLTDDSDTRDLIQAVAVREGLSTAALRMAVVDHQVYLTLQLIDALMQQRTDWGVAGSTQGEQPPSGAEGGDTASSDPARVWRVSYDPLLSGTTVELRVEGSDLDTDVSPVLAGCSDMRMTSGTADARSFSCDLSGGEGGRILQVMDGSDGSLLYESIVSVESSAVDTRGSDAVVSHVGPAKAARSSQQLFTVTGQNLALDTQFVLAGCTDVQVQSRSSMLIEVVCQLDDRATVRAGHIEAADGSSIYPFSVGPLSIDEKSMQVVSVEPAAALEAETLNMVLSGSDFPANAKVQTSACESMVIQSQTDAEIRFSCENAQTGTWPVYAVSEQQTVVAPQSIQVRTVEALVSRVSPLKGKKGAWINLKVSGQHMSAGVHLDLDACAEVEVLDSTPVLRQFGCTLAEPGLYKGRMLAGGKVLHRFDFTVEAASSAQVTSVSPASGNYGEALKITVKGAELPESAQLELQGCNSIALLSATPTTMVFQCTPQRVGSLDGKLLGVGGEELTAFAVNIIDNSTPSESIVIKSVIPTSTYIDAETTFTVSGEELPVTLVLSVEGCTQVEPQGGSDNQRQFRCTPRGESGERKMNIYASEGGALIKTFDLQVTGKELRVNDISPARSAIGVRTTFRISGQNLSSEMVLELEGCDPHLLSSSSELRSYVCAPYGLAGTRTVKARDRLGGNVLYSRAIEVLPAP